VESAAGKSGALHGMYQNGTPFAFSEKDRAVDHFGVQLAAAGFNYHGTERLYNGMSGVELEAAIFVGVVYYQRLRHMVGDKHQVRATGPINSTTRQPIKGRKVHGGIRFGEMERDSLLAHGCAYLLHDRLMNCSDYNTSYVCHLCGSLLSTRSTLSLAPASSGETLGMPGLLPSRRVKCQNCDSSRGITLVAIPYVYTYLANELAAMNIRMTLDVKS